MEKLLFLKLLSPFSFKSKLLPDKVVCCYFFSHFIMKCFRYKGMLKELYSPVPITDFLQLTFEYICLFTSLSLYPAISLSFFLSFEKGWVSAKYVLYTSMMSMKSVMSNSLEHLELQPTRLLGPWISSGKNTRVGCHSLHWGIYLTEGLEPRSPALQQILYLLSHRGLYLNVFFVPGTMLKPLQFSPRHAVMLFPPYPHPSVPKFHACQASHPSSEQYMDSCSFHAFENSVPSMETFPSP